MVCDEQGAFNRIAPAMEGLRDEVGKQVAVGRLGEPAELANLASFLLSPYANWITGTPPPHTATIRHSFISHHIYHIHIHSTSPLAEIYGPKSFGPPCPVSNVSLARFRRFRKFIKVLCTALQFLFLDKSTISQVLIFLIFSERLIQNSAEKLFLI